MRTRTLLVAGTVLALASATFAAQVTFQVDMTAQIALGNFNAASDSIFVAGDPLNGWSTVDSPLAPSQSNPKLWTGTFEVVGEAGATAQYKFLMTTSAGTIWEGNVGPGGPNGNRTLVLSDTDQTLEAVYFNNVTKGISVSSDVTFQVDLAPQVALGAFDAAGGTVNIAGEFNGWSTSAFELALSAAKPNLWTGTTKITGAVDSAVNYKIVINGATWEGNVGPNGAQNRALTLAAGAQTLPIIYFNNVADLGALEVSTNSGGKLSLTWIAGPSIRLQSASNAAGRAWIDVPDTIGQSSATVTIGPGQSYFRLTGP